MLTTVFFTIGWFLVGAVGSSSAAPYRAPRTPDGQPDLQGAWANTTLTSLERPKGFASLYATPAEAAAYLKKVVDQINNVPPQVKPGDPPPKPDTGQSEWYDSDIGLMRIDGKLRASVVTDPADGKIPYNFLGLRAVHDAERRDEAVTEDPEDRNSDERCLIASGSALTPPMIPPVYNARYEVIQTKGFVVMETEMVHDVRIIRLGGSHESVGPKWFGDSVGHWEGETLVVETLNQHPASADRFVRSSILHLTPAAKVTERFTRISPKEIRYAFTVEDSSVYTRPWSGEVVFTAAAQPMYEYACHEGNYALPNILRGARRTDAEAEKKEKLTGTALGKP
jgi:hypothetical protein